MTLLKNGSILFLYSLLSLIGIAHAEEWAPCADFLQPTENQNESLTSRANHPIPASVSGFQNDIVLTEAFFDQLGRVVKGKVDKNTMPILSRSGITMNGAVSVHGMPTGHVGVNVFFDRSTGKAIQLHSLRGINGLSFPSTHFSKGSFPKLFFVGEEKVGSFELFLNAFGLYERQPSNTAVWIDFNKGSLCFGASVPGGFTSGRSQDINVLPVSLGFKSKIKSHTSYFTDLKDGEFFRLKIQSIQDNSREQLITEMNLKFEHSFRFDTVINGLNDDHQSFYIPPVKFDQARLSRMHLANGTDVLGYFEKNDGLWCRSRYNSYSIDFSNDGYAGKISGLDYVSGTITASGARIEKIYKNALPWVLDDCTSPRR